MLRVLQWGGDLPFGEGTLRAFIDEMWSDENIYMSHLGDESPQPRRLDFPVSNKTKQAASQSQTYVPLPPASSAEYRTRYEAANTHHEVNHRSSKQMERDIGTFGCPTELQPGDSRLVQPCAVCMMSLPRKRAPHFSDSFSPEEKRPPGTVWATDTSHLTVVTHGGYRYLQHFCCAISHAHLIHPMRNCHIHLDGYDICT